MRSCMSPAGKLESHQRGFWIEEVKWSEVAQLCPALRNPMDCSPPGSSVQGILQARILKWVAISFSRGSSRPRDQTQVSCIRGRRFNLWATREAIILCSMVCTPITATRNWEWQINCILTGYASPNSQYAYRKQGDVTSSGPWTLYGIDGYCSKYLG